MPFIFQHHFLKEFRSGGATEDLSFVQLSHFLWLQMINRLHYDKWSTQKLLCVCACMCVRRPTPQSLRTGSALSRPTPHGFTQLTVPSLCPSQYTHTDLPLWYRNSKCNLTKVLFQQKGNRNSGISGKTSASEEAVTSLMLCFYQ